METVDKQRSSYVRDLLSGKFLESEFLKRNRLLLFVIFIMMLANISVRYKSAKVLREADTLEREIKELRAQSISVAAEVIKLTRPSQILERIQKSNLGLEPSKVPPRRLYVDKKQ